MRKGAEHCYLLLLFQSATDIFFINVQIYKNIFNSTLLKNSFAFKNQLGIQSIAAKSFSVKSIFPFKKSLEIQSSVAKSFFVQLIFPFKKSLGIQSIATKFFSVQSIFPFKKSARNPIYRCEKFFCLINFSV